MEVVFYLAVGIIVLFVILFLGSRRFIGVNNSIRSDLLQVLALSMIIAGAICVLFCLPLFFTGLNSNPSDDGTYEMTTWYRHNPSDVTYSYSTPEERKHLRDNVPQFAIGNVLGTIAIIAGIWIVALTDRKHLIANERTADAAHSQMQTQSLQQTASEANVKQQLPVDGQPEN